jgi:hypothetical protein
MPRKKSATTERMGEETQSLLANPDRFMEETYDSAKSTLKEYVDGVSEFTQRNPQQALISAVAVGYALRILPTTRILSGVVGLGLALVKPVALIYGVSKLWHLSKANGAE